ncbi:MAG TPA: ribosome maturation factor RimP [Streptosporangiaceae bacterium]|nr:ribosome maturation factor RimP [Streptosporangiaceae bacterium]
MHGGSRRGSHSRAKGKVSGREAGPRAAEVGPLPDTDRLTRLLEPVVHAMDMDLEGIRVASAGRRRVLRVVVDADGGVSLDDIALASRELSVKLDDSAEMGDLPYTLEVSSPGVDRPLTLPRHWRRAAGRLVVAPLKTEATALHDGNGVATAEGRITGWSELGVTLERDGVTREYQYAELGPGRVQVEFGHFADSPDELESTDADLSEED